MSDVSVGVGLVSDPTHLCRIGVGSVSAGVGCVGSDTFVSDGCRMGVGWVLDGCRLVSDVSVSDVSDLTHLCRIGVGLVSAGVGCVGLVSDPTHGFANLPVFLQRMFSKRGLQLPLWAEVVPMLDRGTFPEKGTKIG